MGYILVQLRKAFPKFDSQNIFFGDKFLERLLGKEAVVIQVSILLFLRHLEWMNENAALNISQRHPRSKQLRQTFSCRFPFPITLRARDQIFSSKSNEQKRGSQLRKQYNAKNLQCLLKFGLIEDNVTQIFDSDLKGAWHYNHVTFTPIAKNFMLYCRLIYMLSILCVRLTIQAAVIVNQKVSCSSNKTRMITVIFDSKPTSVLFHMGDFGCADGGWTPVIKMDGNKQTFNYSSTLWSNKETFNLNGGKTEFDSQETKLPSY
ncbi:unnamed protein product [Porites lobata]|uniref:Uncharacterized protein n=1 Tax=Porites lobata TaxID=104759 RepID=A0ABN8NJ20_9CNID|nr:unnamed protein product [Porites lobata]